MNLVKLLEQANEIADHSPDQVILGVLDLLDRQYVLSNEHYKYAHVLYSLVFRKIYPEHLSSLCQCQYCKALYKYVIQKRLLWLMKIRLRNFEREGIDRLTDGEKIVYEKILNAFDNQVALVKSLKKERLKIQKSSECVGEIKDTLIAHIDSYIGI